MTLPRRKDLARKDCGRRNFYCQPFLSPSSLFPPPHSAVVNFFLGLPFVTDTAIKVLLAVLHIPCHFQFQLSFGFNSIPACWGNVTILILGTCHCFCSPRASFVFELSQEFPAEATSSPDLSAWLPAHWDGFFFMLWGDCPWASTNSPGTFGTLGLSLTGSCLRVPWTNRSFAFLNSKAVILILVFLAALRILHPGLLHHLMDSHCRQHCHWLLHPWPVLTCKLPPFISLFCTYVEKLSPVHTRNTQDCLYPTKYQCG